jgi:preprotein translocase subunit YajC
MSDPNHFVVFLAMQESQPSAGPAPTDIPGMPTSGGTETAPATSAPPRQTQPPGGIFGNPLNFFLILIVGMFLVMMLGGRKDRKKRDLMLKGLKKHDRVQTSGGIIGTITEIKDDEVLLRVDEGSNTRIRFARSAVVAIVRSAAGKDEDAKAPVENTPA